MLQTNNTVRSTHSHISMCCAQLIFIGPIGKSYTPQGGNVSPTLVLALLKPHACPAQNPIVPCRPRRVARGACHGFARCCTPVQGSWACPCSSPLLAAPAARSAIVGILSLLPSAGRRVVEAVL